LEKGRNLQMDSDAEKDFPLRDLAYSFCVGLTSTIESIIEPKKSDGPKQTISTVVQQDELGAKQIMDARDVYDALEQKAEEME
ncbi:hypothetical protein PFISCL1PPCAC_28643, partial [Pristionchus fissidentatus]